MSVKWIPPEWARPDSLWGWPGYIASSALSVLTFFAFTLALVPVVAVVALSLAAAIIAISVLAVLFLFGLSVSPRMGSKDQYEHYQEKYGEDGERQ